MKTIIRLALAFLCLFGSSLSIFADDPAAACGAMGCGLFVWLIMMIVVFGISIAIIVFIFKWIKKDATARGMPNADTICWLALLGLLGLLIYVLTRPQGTVMPCPHCGLPRSQNLPQCPHCHKP